VTERVELVYFEGCPHIAEARRELSRALRLCRLAPTWQEWDMTSSDTPQSRKGYGSPTVLVDGVDVTSGMTGSGIGCTVAGAPRAEVIVAALKKQLCW
jgi:mercuric ion transport protein